ncbi:hypothetical protein BK133_05255 [Paenibacillus sp. FSL H8-0548]|uniref:hypothetical protein n=1 Tax=Paenibacillus sp. FSL H8-0548 TaxID=1920422 RepID=UPI00096C891D|nr:hypothetical protein [Paenibacillus sp. FSL H8-0548]OMF37465.1 hypothetical protein BK133_05255 [Paenibacillus sp. FSL H8-0548]
MIVLKDDKVRLANGDVGIVTEVWGQARPFMWFNRESDNVSIPLPASKVVEVFPRPKKYGGGWKD